MFGEGRIGNSRWWSLVVGKRIGFPSKEEREGRMEREVVRVRWIDGIIMHRGRHVVGCKPFVYR